MNIHVIGRQFGKMEEQEKYIRERIAKGEKVAIATKDRLICGNCKVNWNICPGLCVE